MTAAVQGPTRSFTLELPEGFVALPSDLGDSLPDQVGELTAYFARLFSLPPDDENAAAVAVYYAAVGPAAAESGVDHTELAMYRSPDDPDRAMMIMLSSSCVPAGHADVESAVAGLLEIHRAAGQGDVSKLSLPVGPAVVVVTEEQNGVFVGQAALPVLHRKITAWVPDPGGTTVGVVSVSSNNWQDWEHICRLTVDILGTMRWDDRP